MIKALEQEIRYGPVLQSYRSDADPGSTRFAGRGPLLSLSRRPLGAAGSGGDRARHPAGLVRRPRLPRWQNRAADGVPEHLSWRPRVVARLRHRPDKYRDQVRDAGTEAEQRR